MDKKGEITIGEILLAFIGVLVGAVLFLSVMQTVGDASNSIAFTTATGNYTFTMPANGSSVDWTGQDLLSTPVVYNASGIAAISAALYTVGERVSPTTGVKTVYLQADTVPAGDQVSVNATYVYGPDGYINNSGARAVAGIIGIFMALAIVIVAMVPALRSGVLDMVR